ncbi:MAG: hypothetical protein WAN65_25995 [Candidatus Sulfotelmatobacter sp.]
MLYPVQPFLFNPSNYFAVLKQESSSVVPVESHWFNFIFEFASAVKS